MRDRHEIALKLFKPTIFLDSVLVTVVIVMKTRTLECDFQLQVVDAGALWKVVDHSKIKVNSNRFKFLPAKKYLNLVEKLFLSRELVEDSVPKDLQSWLRFFQ